MLDVTNFLMRWLFLCNLIRDVAEIQTLPYNPNQPTQYQDVQFTISHPASCEEEWRENCLRGILAYPPGTQRSLAMDALRAELVQRLSVSLDQADQILHRHEAERGKQLAGEKWSQNPQQEGKQVSDPYLDADLEILRAFSQETSGEEDSEEDKENEDEAVLVISSNGTVGSDENGSKTATSMAEPALIEEEDHVPPSESEVDDAQRTIRTVRDYLPQLVSLVLKSPPPFEPHLLNPVEKLRRVIIKRCVEDANWGVDMCWLLEAEVGRAWKTLFEHRQQTGRRLIIVLQAEKAAVLAKIGSEKKEAFDLLQDAEQATAYGYTVPMDEHLFHHGHQAPHYYGGYHHPQMHDPAETPNSRLPSSLSLRRCSHFGDTMHFIDRLTQVSLDLRQVPTVHRHQCLQDSLREINRRLRRRMVTRGDVSLDVEDDRGPDDWPQISDITADMLQHSVHLPLDPKQQSRWPGGNESVAITNGGVVRVLNIVVDESRLLSSRERCPFLVQVEVAETGLSGKDSRLYAAGSSGLGTTVEEALSMSAAATSAAVAGDRHHLAHGSTPYRIPPELLATPLTSPEPAVTEVSVDETGLVRGGYQSNETAFYSHSPDDIWTSNPYDAMRQNEYEQLHNDMHEEQSRTHYHQAAYEQISTILSTREALLDQVFGQPWLNKCEEIRQASPFGKTPGWRLASFIMKAGEDIRREALVMQIIANLNEWFKELPEELRPHMRPYTIMSVGGDAGIVECLSDAKSIDEVKKRTDGFESLRDYFLRAYGPPTSHSSHYNQYRNPYSSPNKQLTFEEAQDNFLRSLVGYSVVCYILQIKDRHNANILLDREGNIMHIDFGFVLGDTPKMAKVPIFNERAPFKLSGEFWDVLGGWNAKQGGLGVRFCHMFEEAFACAAAHAEEIISLVEASMLTLTQSPRQARIIANGVRNRLKMRGPPGSVQQKTFIVELVNDAKKDWGTSTYDWLQKNMNGYQ